MLTLQLDLPLTELWVLGGVALSLASQLALVKSLEAPASRASLLKAALPLFAVVVLMVFRPTWSSVRR